MSNILGVTAGAVSILAISQFTASSGQAGEAYSTFGHRNVMAAFLSLCLPACSAVLAGAESPWTPIRKAGSFLTLCAFVISYSRGAWLGLALGVLFTLWRLREVRGMDIPSVRNALLGILILIGPLGTLLVLRNPERGIFSASQRQFYWEATVDVLKVHPLVGVGPGNYEPRAPSYFSEEARSVYEWDIRSKNRLDFWQHLHSLYLQTAVEFGLFGLALLCAGIFALVRPAYLQAMAQPTGVKPYFFMSIVGFLVHNTVDLMMVSSLDILFAFLLALCITPSRSQALRST
jgi:O-antigen ligase